MDVAVTNAPDEQRYEARVGDELAGFTAYRERPGLIAFMHTQVDSRFEGQGVGGRLVAGALEDARARALAVLPFCPFVNSYIRRHSELVALVPESNRAQFGL
jgi:predicted GNAT family acetyltransferase